MPLRLSQAQAADLLRSAAGTSSKSSTGTKFRNRRTTTDSGTFDSAKEARRWGELQLMERAGLISRLERQVPYELAPGVRFLEAKRAQPALRIVVDFRYQEQGQTVLEDTKGGKATQTRAFIIKRHLLLSLHGLHIRIV